jgi:hypothetical protein
MVALLSFLFNSLRRGSQFRETRFASRCSLNDPHRGNRQPFLIGGFRVPGYFPRRGMAGDRRNLFFRTTCLGGPGVPGLSEPVSHRPSGKPAARHKPPNQLAKLPPVSGFPVAVVRNVRFAAGCAARTSCNSGRIGICKDAPVFCWRTAMNPSRTCCRPMRITSPRRCEQPLRARGRLAGFPRAWRLRRDCPAFDPRKCAGPRSIWPGGPGRCRRRARRIIASM